MEHASCVVAGEGNTARQMGSGDLDVFATPAMVALMENAAMLAVAGSLPEGSTTVGCEVSVSHTRASKRGAKITATARLVSVEGRRLTYELAACDEHGPVGGGLHVRMIVDAAKFIGKLL